MKSWISLTKYQLRALVKKAYNWVGEVVNSFFVADEGAVDSVDNKRRPADDEHDDDKDQRHCDVSLLLVHLILVYGRTVSQMSSVSSDFPHHTASTQTHRQHFSFTAKLHYTDTGYKHQLRTPPTDKLTTILQQICHIAMPEPNISTCQDVGMWQILSVGGDAWCSLVVFVAGVCWWCPYSGVWLLALSVAD